MRYTIRPKGEGVISWMLKYGSLISEPRSHRSDTSVAVCIVRHQSGPVAYVCYNLMELQHVRSIASHDVARWFWVPIVAVKPFMHGQEIK